MGVTLAELNQKDVRNLPLPAAGVVVAKMLADSQKRSPIKPEARPLQDDTDVDKKTGLKREGNNNATKITFFSFDANDAEGQDYGGAMTNTSVSASDAVLSGNVQNEQEFIQEWQRSVQTAQSYWQDSAAYYHEQAAFEQSLWGTPYGSYYTQPIPDFDPVYGFDQSRPEVTTYLGQTKLMFDADGQLNSIDDGTSCLNPTRAGGRGEAILAALSTGGPRDLTDKVDLVKSATIDVDGNLMMGEACMDPNSAAGKQIIMAKAQLDAGQTPTALAQASPQTPQLDPLAQALPLTAKLDGTKTPGSSAADTVFIATGPVPNAQGSDLFMATNALQRDQDLKIMNKPNALSASTKEVAPDASAAADLPMPKQVSAIAGPALA